MWRGGSAGIILQFCTFHELLSVWSRGQPWLQQKLEHTGSCASYRELPWLTKRDFSDLKAEG
ncbi:hypothetical protein BN77_p10522 [Rhizobium mesoamericanum STM3625]|uniref:Uncharacterized protein n=1 Tax=Rhizobium mesoamericanum STM3625 TaxID=1211777 RepID=K0PZ12_9HYPH|nr:hypothetical protein BN77_p10522 [Rhizobium mesoamericanum STM3625]